MPNVEVTSEALDCFLKALVVAFANVESVLPERRTTRFVLSELKENLEAVLETEKSSESTRLGSLALCRRMEELLQPILLYKQDPAGGVQ